MPRASLHCDAVRASVGNHAQGTPLQSFQSSAPEECEAFIARPPHSGTQAEQMCRQLRKRSCLSTLDQTLLDLRQPIFRQGIVGIGKQPRSERALDDLELGGALAITPLYCRPSLCRFLVKKDASSAAPWPPFGAPAANREE